jgi:hypothetical protein
MQGKRKQSMNIREKITDIRFYRLKKHRQSIFTFLTYPNIPPDNNVSESSIRNVKVKTKVSGQFRNAEGKGAERFSTDFATLSRLFPALSLLIF